MIKNGTVAMMLGTITCAVLFTALFLVRTCNLNVPGIFDDISTPSNNTFHTVAIDLNSASAKELSEIPGMGSALAERIVTYREKYGKYVDIDELLELKGMSDELYEQIKQYVCIGGS